MLPFVSKPQPVSSRTFFWVASEWLHQSDTRHGQLFGCYQEMIEHVVSRRLLLLDVFSHVKVPLLPQLAGIR